MTPNQRPRRRRGRLRPALLAAGLLAPALVAMLALARPAAAATQPAPAPAATAGHQPATRAELDALVKPASVAAPAAPAAASGGKGVCNVPGIGDLGSLVGLCGPGSGIIGDVNGQCKNPPVPEPPGDSISGWLELQPARPPAPAAAFGPRATSTEFDQYGYAGLSWVNYDQPCLIPQVSPDIETMLGNWMMSVSKVIVATDNTVHSWASSPSWMTALTPIVTGSTSTLYKTLFLLWAGVALLCVAISVVFRAHRSDTSGAVTLTAWAVLVLGLVATVVAAPGWAGQQAQVLMGSTLSAMDSGFAGPGSQASAEQAHDSLLVQSVLYPAWLRGELGNPDSATSQKYGPLLFQEQALTWAQATGTPAQVAAATKNDQTAWAKTAAQVEATDPGAYEVLTGNSLDRMGAGFLAVLTAVIVCTFDVIASLVVITALLGVLAGTVLLPAVGVAGMHHRLKHLITGLGSRILGMLLNGILWGAAAGVDEVATRALLTQNILPLPLVLLVLAILPLALWLIIRRLRGRQPIPPAARRLVMMGLGYRLLRGGARRGAQDALEQNGGGPQQQPMFYQRPWTWTASTNPPTGPAGLPPAPPPTLPPNPGGGLPPGPGPGGGAPPQLPPGPGPQGPNGHRGPNGPNDPRFPNHFTYPKDGPAWQWGNWGPRRRPDAGPREYTGGDDSSDPDVINPTDVFGPGENPGGSDLDDAGLYNGGA